MGLSAASIIPLLSKWEDYLGEQPDGNIEGFARWVLAKTPAAEADSPAATADHTDPSSQTTLLITRIHRILELLHKPVAKELGFQKPLEFSMLVQTAIMNRPNKKQLCQEMLIEGSTGVEITKRLALKGFIKEQPDSKDRRSALLSLTDKGKETLLRGYTKLNAIHSGFLEGLQPEEKQQLVHLLARLNDVQTQRLPPLS